MIDITVITKALQSLLASAPAIVAAGVKQVTRGDYVNVDPNRAPWIGIYRNEVDHTPHTLGTSFSQRYQSTVTVRIVAQAVARSGEEAEDKLEALVRTIIDAVIEDPAHVNGTVDMVTDLNVAYSYVETELETLHFQQAIIKLTAEVRTG